MTGYELSRQWFDFAFENPEKINPNHTAMYFFAIEHCNRLGWKKKFGFPSTMVMEAMGVKSYNTYKKTLDDLVDWGFFIMVEKSKNQYSSNIIALSKNNKALDKALDKALSKHDAKQSESKESINKQTNKEQVTNNYMQFVDFWNEVNDCNLRMTDTKRTQIKARLNTYSEEELKTSIRNRSKDDWINGEGKKFKTNWDSFWRNDEKAERYLNFSDNEPTQQELERRYRMKPV